MANLDIDTLTRANPFFREVVATGAHSQVVVMSLPPGGEIGAEVHAHVDQVLVFLVGEGFALLDGERSQIRPGSLVLVPAGTMHNIVNGDAGEMKLFTVYAPPQHAPGTIHRTKAEADEAEAEHESIPAGSIA